MLRQHGNAGFDADQDEPAQQDRHAARTGDTEQQRRNERAALLGVVGRFRCKHAAHVAGAECFAVLAGLDDVAVSDPVHHRPTKAGQGADDAADDAAAEHDPPMTPDVLEAFGPAVAKFRRFGDAAAAAEQVDDLRHRKHPETDDDDRNTIAEVDGKIRKDGQIGVRNEAEFASRRRRAHCAKQQAEAAGRQPLERAGPCEHADHAEREDDEEKLFAKTHRQDDRARGEDGARQDGGAEQTAEHGRREGRAQCTRAFAFLCHGEAVNDGCLRVGGPGNSHQHRREGVRRRRRRNKPDHHRECVRRIHSEDERQHDRQTCDAAKSGQNADDHAEHDAQEQVHEVMEFD